MTPVYYGGASALRCARDGFQNGEGGKHVFGWVGREGGGVEVFDGKSHCCGLAHYGALGTGGRRCGATCFRE